MRWVGSREALALLFLPILILLVCFPSDVLGAVDRELAVAHIDSLRLSYRALPALASIEEVLPDARAQGDSSFVLELLVRKGGLNASIGRLQAGEQVLNEAITLAEALSDSLLLCEGLRWLGVSLEGMGRVDEALDCYARLLRVAESSGSQGYQGWALVGFAWRDFVTGRSSDSARRYREAIAHFQSSTDRRGGPWAWNGLGTALSRLGEYDEARDCFQRAATLARENRDGMVESMALNNLGTLTFSLGDPGAAADHFERARVLQIELGYAKGALTPALNVTRCRMSLGRYEEAEAELRSLLRECREENYVDVEAMVLDQLANLELQRGRLHRAAAIFQQTLELRHLPFKQRIRARMGLSRVEGMLGNHAHALTILEEGRNEIADRGLRQEAMLLEAEIGICLHELGHHREALAQMVHVDQEANRLGLSDVRVQALARAAASCRALGLADSALAFLLEGAAVWEKERRLPLDPEWREQRGEAGRLLYTDLAAQLIAPRGGIPEQERHRQAFDQLQIFKARTLLERMLGPGSSVGAAANEQPTLTLDHLQGRVLNDGELLLDFYLGPNVSFLFAVTRTECRLLTLPPEPQLSEKLRYHFGFLSQPPHQGDSQGESEIIQASSDALRDLLLHGVEDLIAGSQLVFVANDGPLNLLAFAALVPAKDDGMASWTRIPSATVLAHLRESTRENADSAAAKDRKEILALVGNEPGKPVLPGARYEAEELARRYKGVDLHIGELDSGITKGTFDVTDLVPYELLHLAAHANVDDQSPWQSSIRLASTGRVDRVSAADIATARLGARLAVLAACESAGGRVLSGEGVLGLASAFISAGVPAVVATLWPVDDAETARLMEHFYSGLAEGLNVAMALQNARQSLRAAPDTHHPFFWAGYVLIGDGQIQVPLEHRRSLSRMVPGALAVGVFLSLLLSFRPRRR